MARVDESLTIQVPKDQLLEALRANKEEHMRIWEEAREGFYASLIEKLRTSLENTEQRALPRGQVRINETEPRNYGRVYDEAISMLEIAQNNVIELTQGAYRQYVMDRWDWQEHFLASNSYYTQSASSKFADYYGED